MLHAARIVALTCAALITGCIGVPIERQFWSTGVRPHEWDEIRIAMRKYTSAPVVLCSRFANSEGKGRVMVTTQQGDTYTHYWAEKVDGTWRVKVIEGVITAMNASNQAMQRTASSPRRVRPKADKAATAVQRVCHPRIGCVARFTGLAVADLVSR